MSRLYDLNVEIKMVPGHLEYMIGKANIERLDDVSLLDIDYAYNRPFNRFVKRMTDIVFSIVVVPLFLPVAVAALPFNFGNYYKRILSSVNGADTTITDYRNRGLFRFWIRMWAVLKGTLTIVGAPFPDERGDAERLTYKTGLTGMVQVNEERIRRLGNSEELEIAYLKNHSLFLDLEIIYKALIKCLRSKRRA